MSSNFAWLARWAIPPQDYTSVAWGRQDCRVWCRRAVGEAWRRHHAVAHSIEESMLNAGSMLHLWENSSIPHSWTSGKLGGTDSASSYLTFQRCSHFEWEQLSFSNSTFSSLMRACDTGWQFSSASTETFGNSAISYLKPEYKSYTQAWSSHCHS